ncbi:MAG: hypothetical protein LLG13_18185 [Bacteroidales bacterium]|nr:hypothetical protein [Bacteroidales bacterium]
MEDSIQYIVDDNGIKTSVIIPFDRWKKINEKYQKLQNKLKVFHAIQEGLEEIKTAKRQQYKLQTLSGFLNESHSQSYKKL